MAPIVNFKSGKNTKSSNRDFSRLFHKKDKRKAGDTGTGEACVLEPSRKKKKMQTSTPVHTARSPKKVLEEDKLSPVGVDSLHSKEEELSDDYVGNVGPTGISDNMTGMELTPVRMTESVEERDLCKITVNDTNAAMGAGVIKRTRSNPEISIDLDRNVMFNNFPTRRASSVDRVCFRMSPWNDVLAYEEFKKVHDERKKEKKLHLTGEIVNKLCEKVVECRVTAKGDSLPCRESAIILGVNASRNILDSPATPAPRASLKRMLQLSPDTPFSFARRFSFSNMGDASPKLKENATRQGEKMTEMNLGKKKIMLFPNSSTMRGRSMSLSDASNIITTPRRVRKIKQGKKKLDIVASPGQRKLTDMLKKVVRDETDGPRDADKEQVMSRTKM